MSKYFLYCKISQKCQWKQFGRSPWEKTSSPLPCERRDEREGRKKVLKKRMKIEGEREKRKAAVNRGRGGERRGKRVGACAVRNADPFPRWSLWTVSLPTAGPKNHIVPRLSLPPALLSAGLPPRKHNVSAERIPPDCIYSYSKMNEAVSKLQLVKSGFQNLQE